MRGYLAVITLSALLVGACVPSRPVTLDEAAEDGSTCPDGLTDCNGTCVDKATDHDNCGHCGHSCGASWLVCLDGECIDNHPGQTDCGGSLVDLQSAKDHCGTCNVKCEGNKTCQSGICACPASLPEWCGTTCTNTAVDENNCGACGIVCAADETCINGQCT